MEFANIILQRKNTHGLNGHKLDLATFNVLMAIDGSRSIRDISHEDIYDEKVLAEKVQRLLNLDLIEPVAYNGKTIDSNIVKRLIMNLCQPAEGLDSGGFNKKNKETAKQLKHQSNQSDRGQTNMAGTIPRVSAAKKKTVKQQKHQIHRPIRRQTNTAGAVPRVSASNIVFKTMMLHIFDTLEKTNAQDFKSLCRELNETAKKFQVPNSNALEIVRWLNQPDKSITIELPIELLSEVITSTYALICEYYGPDIADHALQSAARAASAIPEAQEVSPSQFL
jgi:hypothetical protein